MYYAQKLKGGIINGNFIIYIRLNCNTSINNSNNFTFYGGIVSMEQLKDSELCKYCLGCEQILIAQDVHHCENFVKVASLTPFYEALRKEGIK